MHTAMPPATKPKPLLLFLHIHIKLVWPPPVGLVFIICFQEGVRFNFFLHFHQSVCIYMLSFLGTFPDSSPGAILYASRVACYIFCVHISSDCIFTFISLLNYSKIIDFIFFTILSLFIYRMHAGPQLRHNRIHQYRLLLMAVAHAWHYILVS